VKTVPGGVCGDCALCTCDVVQHLSSHLLENYSNRKTIKASPSETFSDRGLSRVGRALTSMTNSTKGLPEGRRCVDAWIMHT
jgi:hypothetical protein